MSRKILLLTGSGIVVAIGALLWVNRGIPSLRWRSEVVEFKFSGALPEESWAGVIRRIIPGTGDSSSPFTGLRLNALGAGAEAVSQGATLFMLYCASCHGDAGRGGRVEVDLSSLSLQSGLSDLDIYTAVTQGTRGSMPPITGDIQRALKLTAYVRSLASHAANVPCAACERVQVSENDIAGNFTGAGGWLSYSGDYTGQRFSPYRQIDKSNVSKLRARFVFQTQSLAGLEAVPLVVNELMFLTGPDNEVIALDVDTGDPLWEYRRVVAPNLRLCCGRPNRGVAVLGGRIFHGTLDGRLVALDVRTGKELWNVEVVDHRDGYSMTGAPLAINDKIIVGVAGGDNGARGVIDAYDPATGRRLWRFDTVPPPGHPGHETWPGDSWKNGGGATWLTGTYDPALELVYWGVGNPAREFNPASRPGDNLFTSSVVALDANTGALRWHYQFTPNDGNDWDASSIPVLADAKLDGVPRKLMLFASRNCFFYALDRETGKFLHAAPFCEQNWNDGFTPEGRPLRRPGSTASPNGPLIRPGTTGGANWMSPAYDAGADVLVVKNYHGGQRVFSQETTSISGGRFEQPQNLSTATYATALRGLTGEVVWEAKQGGENTSGVLATAAGLVFTGDSEGRLSALDITTGKQLWSFRLGAQISMAPITYLHRGKQEIAVISGGALFVLSLP